MFCLRNRDKKKYPILLDWRHMIIRAFLDIYISVWWTQKVFKWPEPSTNRVFNCVQYFHGLCIVRNIMKIRTLFERFSKRYYICQRSQKILNSFPFDKLTIKTYGYWCKYLHNEKEFCFKKLNWKCRSKLLNNLF